MASKVVFDPLLEDVVMHDHTDKLNLSGGIVSGDITYPATGYIMKDSNGVRWKVTVGTDGALITTAVATTPITTPWLWMFGTV